MSKSVVYVTKSSFKREENVEFVQSCHLSDGTPVKDGFSFEIREVEVKEILEVDLRAMVMDEVAKAYSSIKIPCIVEHAGLIFDPYENFPGGLTKPMWNDLGDKFLEETGSANRKATARAVVAYCDGMGIKTFVGETKGVLADKPRGDREFYWDTVFIPDGGDGKTYAEIVEDPDLGLNKKVVSYSQSSKAMIKFLEYLNDAPTPMLWPA